MKVIYFTRDYTPHDHRFLTALAGSQHDVALLRLERRGPPLEQRALPGGIREIAWKGGRRPFRWGDAPELLDDLKRVIAVEQPDLIHAGPIQTAAWLAGRSGFHPLVSMSWGSDLLRDADRSDRWRRITATTLQRSDLLVGDCQAVRAKAAAFGFPAERMVIFPWGVDLEHFRISPQRGELRNQLGWEANFILLSLRAWEPLYGVDVVARAFVEAARSNDDLRLVLLGSGSQTAAIHAILEQGGVLPKVYLGGQVSYDDLPRFYSAADAYISASHSDGSSVSLLEALACELPALVSDIPANREWIKPGENGWWFADGDADGLAQRIEHLYNHRPEILQMAKANRGLAERRANWPDNFRMLLQGYEQASQWAKERGG